MNRNGFNSLRFFYAELQLGYKLLQAIDGLADLVKLYLL